METVKPPCPCCTDRTAKGFIGFKLSGPAPENACEVCVEAGEEVDGDALVASLLAKAPVRLQWNLTTAQVSALAEAIIARSKKACDAVVAAHTGGAALTWENSLGVLAADDAEFSTLESVATFPSHTATSKPLRDACSEADTKLSAYAVEASARKDLYEATLAFSQTEAAAALAGEKKRYLERRLRDFRRVGLHLDEATSNRVKEINTRCSELGIKFSKHLGEEDTKFSFSAAELDGCVPSYLEERKQDDGSYTVSLKYPDYIPLMERCRVGPTRKTMEAAFNSRCKEENTPILEELVRLRDEKAQLMGYETHADFVTEVRMSKSAAKVKAFLSELGEKLRPLLASDLAALKALKAKHEPDAETAEVTMYDRTYYSKLLEEEKFKVDHEALKAYFELSTVAKGLLGIYQQLLGLTFDREKSLEGAAAWHAEVEAYRVSDTKSGELVGYFYLDMHPREGKYGHAACFGLQPACATAGGWQVPVAAAVCNFPRPTASQPALLSHRDVETFFHEFGHVMHQLCSKAELEMFAGTRVERDFVEAPSQMLENWCWQPAALARMSAHHQTGEPIPDALMAALLASRNANSGILNMRQIVLASFDQAIHTAASADTAAVLDRISAELLQIPSSPGTNMAASFGHLAGGYDAQYYGYMWSEVFSADMFASRFEAEGIFNGDLCGASYRKEILAAGGSRDAMDSLIAFLGREPIQEPFLKSKGLE